jgi:predicted amidophosphoribosyltransferase
LSCIDYDSGAAAIVKEFKQTGSRFLCQKLAVPMAQALVSLASRGIPAAVSAPQLHPEPQGFLLLPAPSRPKANRERGYTPATMLATEVALQMRASGVSARALQIFKMSRFVGDQTLLSAAARHQNIDGHMSLEPGAERHLSGKTLVMFDDIVTTGATLREMNRVVQLAGFESAIFLTFAETL